MNSPPPLAIQLLGGFSASVAGTSVPATAWQQRRAAAVVKLLALQPQYRLHREVLMETLWPDLESDQAANNLRVAMHRARQRLDDAGAPPGRFLTRRQDDVVLADPSDVVVDVQRFSEAAQTAWVDNNPSLTQAAVNLYTGDLLPEDPYEEWAAHRRTDMRISYLALLSRLAQLHEARNEDNAAIAATQQLLATEPLDEAAHASLMRRYARIGAHSQALAQYDALTALLARELDAEPDESTTALRDEIRSVAQAGETRPQLITGRPQEDASPTLDAAGWDSAAGLIGRDRELAELGRLLERRRLVTLVGPAGVGKTRLAEALVAMEAARGRRGQVIELADVSQPDFLPGALASALGVAEPEVDPSWGTIVAHIGQSHVLLVLDNFEQILSAGPNLADMLRACPRLSLVVTSRERLRLRAEHIYDVTPLVFPDPTQPETPALASYPAIALFVERAGNADPAFAPSATDLRAIAEVCQRVDGLPLAIELAAARVRVLPPVTLLTHMEHPLSLLTGGPRDAPARQRTMRAAIAWSVDLLGSDARALFRQLACFPGSFSLRAIEEIAEPPTMGGKPGNALHLDDVEALVDSHLLHRVDPDPATPRFAMLTVIREYAGELLDRAADARSTRARHANHFSSLARAQAPLLTTEDAATVLNELDMELPNLRAAIATLLDQGEDAAALRLATDLWRFWLLRGHISEGRHWLGQALASTGDERSALQGSALDADGVLAFAQGDFSTARSRHDDALLIARQHDDAALAARALVNLGAVADEQGFPEQAAAYLEEALQVSRASGDHRALAVALANLGQVAISLAQYARAADLLNEAVLAFRALADPRSEAAILANLGLMSLMTGDAPLARHCHLEALRVFRDLGDQPAEAAELLNLGHATQQLGDRDEAATLFGEALAYFTQLGDRSGMAFAELHLGKLALLRSELDPAQAHLARALEAAETSHDWVATAESLEGLAMLHLETGEPNRAAQALGAAGELRDSLGLPLPAIHQKAVNASLRSLEAALPAAEREAARALGSARVRNHFAAIKTGEIAPGRLLALAGGDPPPA